MVSLKFFIDIILPGALWPWELTQSVTEMSTRNISWGKGGQFLGVTNIPPSFFDCFCFNFLQPSGPLQEVLYLYLYLLLTSIRRKGKDRDDSLQAMKSYMRNGGVAPAIHNLSAIMPVKTVWVFVAELTLLSVTGFEPRIVKPTT